MPHYRLYRLDPYTGHIVGADDIHGADDVAVIHEIQLRSYKVPVELWQGGRKVTHIDAPPEVAASGAVVPHRDRAHA